MESTSTTFAPESELAKLLQTSINSNKNEDLSSLVDFVKQIEPNVFVEQNSKEEQLILACLDNIVHLFHYEYSLEEEVLYKTAQFELYRLLNYDTLSKEVQSKLYTYVYIYPINCFHRGNPSFNQKIEVMTSVCKSLLSTNPAVYAKGYNMLTKDRFNLDFVIYVAGSDHEKSAFFKQAMDRYYQGVRLRSL